MKIMELTIQEGFYQRTFKFSPSTNIIYSKKNTVGKTTLVRAMLYALGYPIPNINGMNYHQLEFWTTVENKGKSYRVYRLNTFLSIEDDGNHREYSLPTQFNSALSVLTGCENNDVLSNTLGVLYMDQERGSSMLNYGTVIGNVHFSVEALIRGLANKECTNDLEQLSNVEKSIKKYRYMLSVGEYQKENGLQEMDDSPDDPSLERDRKIEALLTERKALLEEIEQISHFLRKNTELVDFIARYHLMVLSESGEEIPVTKQTLVGFEDHTEFMKTRREILASDVAKINQQLSSLQEEKESKAQLLDIQSAIASFDSDIRKIKIDAIATKRIIDQLQTQREQLQERIKRQVNEGNDVALEMQSQLNYYTQKFGIPNVDVSEKNRKHLSGLVLYKTVFAFKLSYIKMIERYTGLSLPIILDSPTGKEVEYSTVEKMLQMIQQDLPDHQLIIASIYDFGLNDKNVIELKDRLFNDEDMLVYDS